MVSSTIRLSLVDLLSSVPFEAGQPSCLIAPTHKGHVVSLMADRVERLHRVPTEVELAVASEELDGTVAT